jgi:hypothetical protein
MEKNWLIRTKSNHILGPISKEKVVELYSNGSIKPDDEVCSGNGFWFFIREDEMVQKYLTGNETQGFNPISEAKDVLTSAPQSRMSLGTTEDITMVGNLNISMLNKSEAPSRPANVSVPPEEVPHTKILKAEQIEQAPPEIKKKNDEGIKPKVSVTSKSRPLKKQNYLQYFLLLGFIILLTLVYFRKIIIGHIFQGEVTSRSIEFFSVAHAQEGLPGKKKSS